MPGKVRELASVKLMAPVPSVVGEAELMAMQSQNYPQSQVYDGVQSQVQPGGLQGGPGQSILQPTGMQQSRTSHGTGANTGPFAQSINSAMYLAATAQHTGVATPHTVVGEQSLLGRHHGGGGAGPGMMGGTSPAMGGVQTISGGDHPHVSGSGRTHSHTSGATQSPGTLDLSLNRLTGSPPSRVKRKLRSARFVSSSDSRRRL